MRARSVKNLVSVPYWWLTGAGDKYRMRKFINIVESAQLTQPLHPSIPQQGDVMPYGELPQAGKNAIQVYYSEFHDDGEMSELTNGRWVYGDIPVEQLKNAIMASGEFDEYASFEDYHSAYLAGGDIPDHQDASYAVILDSDPDGEVILDGWHRFHDYVRKGVATIPAIVQA